MNLRIFLSSTFEDLREARSSVVRHLEVVPGEIIRMELFGSDESKPLDYCLHELRKSNLFVGIYAERYGTIDSASGLSMIEHEYDEACRLAARGEMIGLLLYVLDPRAKWPVHL